MLSLALVLSTSAAHAGLVVNEVLADPGTVAGDANCDGVMSTTQDEFIEIVNSGPSSVDMSNYTYSDGVGVRHTFAQGTVLAANQAIVLFGGGTPTFNVANPAIGSWCQDLSGVLFAVATSGTQLNNSGDTVTIADANGNVVATYTYGAEGNNDQSLTLSPDLDGTNPMVEHTTVSAATWSPGTMLDGTPWDGAGAAQLTLSAPLPGTAGTNNTWHLANGAPNTAYVLVGGLQRGQTIAPICPNTPASIANAQVVGQALTNAQGAANFTAMVPAGLAGRTAYVQAAAPSLCEVSNLVSTTF